MGRNSILAKKVNKCYVKLHCFSLRGFYAPQRGTKEVKYRLISDVQTLCFVLRIFGTWVFKISHEIPENMIRVGKNDHVELKVLNSTVKFHEYLLFHGV